MRSLSSVLLLITALFQLHDLSHCLRARSLLKMAASVETKPREFMNLKPLPCSGNYIISDGDKIPAVYLGPEKMTVQERGDEKLIARGLLPVLLREELQTALGAAMQADSRSSLYRSWSGQLITDRNGGLYDNLKKTFMWANKPYARKEVYESMRLRGTCDSPYHGIIQAIDRFADLKVCGLLIELADSPTPYSQVLGATVLISKSKYAAKWKLTCRRTKAIRAVRGSNEAQLVKCTMDELMGLAYVTQLPVVMKTTLYEGSIVDGLIERDSGKDKTTVTSPYFSSAQEAKLWRSEQTRQEKLGEQQRKKAKRVMTASEIPDASTFLRLKNAEKRAILRATGLTELPRPREGPRAVDALMIPLLDEEVAYEVLRRLAETRGDFEMAARMSDFESRKPVIARQIMEARRAGDHEKSKELCDELNALSTLKFDPTNPDGLAGEWDVEEWYWEQRKRVYGIIAA